MQGWFHFDRFKYFCLNSCADPLPSRFLQVFLGKRTRDSCIAECHTQLPERFLCIVMSFHKRRSSTSSSEQRIWHILSNLCWLFEFVIFINILLYRCFCKKRLTALPTHLFHFAVFGSLAHSVLFFLPGILYPTLLHSRRGWESPPVRSTSTLEQHDYSSYVLFPYMEVRKLMWARRISTLCVKYDETDLDNSFPTRST